MAKKSVTETNIPSAWVPPKLDATKIENPKNKIMEVLLIFLHAHLALKVFQIDLFTEQQRVQLLV